MHILIAVFLLLEARMELKELKKFLLESLEHEMGGVKVYEAALKCAQNDELRDEWERYHSETETHVRILHDVCSAMKIDPQEQSPGREIIRDLGASLIRAMEKALAAGDPAAAQIVAAECVVLAETKDHLDWQLIGEVAKKATGAAREALKEAWEEVEDQEDEHLYHTKGWCRELWMECLGLPAVLPPPEEKKHVKTAIGAARAEQSRKSH
jgi:rubrerythrin